MGAWDLGKEMVENDENHDIRYYYIREVISRKHACVFFINSDQNPADMFTKNLGSVKFLKYRGELELEFLE